MVRYIVSIEGKAITYILQALKTAFMNGPPFSFFVSGTWGSNLKKCQFRPFGNWGTAKKDIPTPWDAFLKILAPQVSVTFVEMRVVEMFLDAPSKEN